MLSIGGTFSILEKGYLIFLRGIMRKIIVALIVAVFVLSGVPAMAGKVTDNDVTSLVELTAEAMSKNAYQTLARINKAEHPYKNKANPALYVFVLNTDLTLVAHPIKIKIVGKNMKGKPDIKGKLFRDEFLAVAKKDGSGWVDYYYENPKSKKMEHKNTFVKLVKGSNGEEYIIGCGKYFGK
jgi:polar amino acid transport system substrate-binding protein